MEKTIKQLLDLVNCTINNTEFNEPIIDEKLLFIIAQENGLSGLIYNKLNKSFFSEKIYSLFQQAFYQYHVRDIKQMNSLTEINKLFNNAGINHIFLKGSYIKTLYPETFMRSMGDIDILIKDIDLDKAHEVLESNGYVNIGNSYNHDSFEKGKDVIIEVHPKLNSEFNDKYNDLFSDVWGNTYLLGKYQYQFNPEFNLVYILYHTAKHLSSSGIGLRTILDIGLLTKSNYESLDHEKLSDLLNKVNLTLFFKNMLWLNKEYFNINYLPGFITDFNTDDKFLTDITEFIVTSGIHGTGSKFNSYICGMTAKTLDETNVKKGKKAYILSILFPKYKSMKATYSYLNKYKFLLPLAWFQRFFRLAFKKTGSSIRKIKKLHVDDTEIAKNVELYRKLGL